MGRRLPGSEFPALRCGGRSVWGSRGCRRMGSVWSMAHVRGDAGSLSLSLACAVEVEVETLWMFRGGVVVVALMSLFTRVLFPA